VGTHACYTLTTMFTSLSALSLILAASSAVASPFSQDKSSLVQRENDTAGKSHSTTPNVVRSTWDGKCFYPTADETFHLEEYLGKWYQVAGTVAEFTAGCSCITAEYSLNVSPASELGTFTYPN